MPGARWDVNTPLWKLRVRSFQLFVHPMRWKKLAICLGIYVCGMNLFRYHHECSPGTGGSSLNSSAFLVDQHCKDAVLEGFGALLFTMMTVVGPALVVEYCHGSDVPSLNLASSGSILQL